MARQRKSIGRCPHCRGPNLACSYNHFSNGELTIDAWEHKCPDCGQRETRAFRSDETSEHPSIDPRVCPFCARVAENEAG